MRWTHLKGGSASHGAFFLALACGALAWSNLTFAETFRVATYNLDNYLDVPVKGRKAKSEEAKAKIRESILAIKPDVLALEEVGSMGALKELRESLRAVGLDLPNWEFVAGSDTNIHVALLSKFRFTSVRPQTNDVFLLNGIKLHVKRGFAVVDIQVNTNYSFTLIAAHLKSKVPSPVADEGEERLEEAKLLREKIDATFATNANVNLIVLGDLNDYKNSKPIREVIGQGKHKLVDTRPVEQNGDDSGKHALNVAWTHYYSVEDVYSRLDYILLSPAMAREWVASESYVLALPNWGKGSDHRPVVATFEAEDK